MYEEAPVKKSNIKNNKINNFMLVITANIALENVKVDNIASECKEKI